MAQVPYQPFSTAQPESPGEQLRVSTPPAAFGENIGAAVQQLGTTVEHVGDELFGRALALQDLRNETDAREAAANYSEQVALKQSQFDALEGKAKVDALPGHLQDLKNLRTQVRGTLGTANAQRMFDADSFNFMNRNIFTSAGQAGEANKKYIIGTADNDLVVSSKSWADPTSDAEFDEKERRALAAVETKNGILQDGRDEARRLEAKSQLWAGRIDALSKVDAQAAQKMFDSLPKGTLLDQDYNRTLDHVQTQNHTVGSRVIADKVTADLIHGPATAQRPIRPLQDYLDEGDKLAEQQAPNDPSMRDYVRARITSLYNGHNASIRDFKYQNINTINEALVGGENGKIPSSLEELNALGPKYQQAWNNLDATTKKQVLKSMATTAKGDVAWTVGNLRDYQRLKGMALDDPAKFLDIDPISQNIPFTARRELINLQQRIIARSQQDPRVPRAMQDLTNLIPSSIRDDKDARQQYMGVLGDTLADFQEQNKRPPTFDELKEINARLLQQQVTEKGWLWDTKGPLYNLPIPQEEVDKMTEKLKKDTGQDYSDEQVRRGIIREQYNKLYPAKTKATVLGPGEEILK